MDLARRMSGDQEVPDAKPKSGGKSGSDQKPPAPEVVSSPVDARPTASQRSQPEKQEPTRLNEVDSEEAKLLRQKSINQRYSSFAMPTLEEVKTPAPTPVTTLTKAGAPRGQRGP